MNSQSNKVRILIPVYNRESLIEETANDYEYFAHVSESLSFKRSNS
jgi:hypothetical protein